MNEPDKPKKIKLCPQCGGEIKFWRFSLCPTCDPKQTLGKPSKKRRPSDQPALPASVSDKPEPPLEPVSGVGSIGQPENDDGAGRRLEASAGTVPSGKASKRGILNEGAPTKQTPELLAAIFDDLALGMTEEQACWGNGVRPETFSRWKNEPENEGLRARAQCVRIKGLIAKMEADPDNWRPYSWQMERIFKSQYGDPAKIGVQINQQFNNGNGPAIDSARLEETRKRLDEVELMRAHWQAGTATEAELRELMIRERDQAQHVIDLIDAGKIPNQEEQQDLHQRFHGERQDRQQPIKEAIGRVTDSNDYQQLAIEDAQQTTSGTSMCASETDPSSGQTAPPEHLRQRDRKTLAGPLSERQRMLAQQRRMGRSDGDSKSPF